MAANREKMRQEEMEATVEVKSKWELPWKPLARMAVGIVAAGGVKRMSLDGKDGKNTRGKKKKSAPAHQKLQFERPSQ